MINADGSNPHQVGNAYGDEPSWSPNSSQIVFHRCDPRRIYPLLYQCVAGLSIIGADGSGLRRLTTGPDMSPTWSPDGSSIVFASGRNLPQLPGSYARPLELYEVTPDRQKLHPLTFAQPADVVTEVAIHNGTGRLLSTFQIHGAPYLCGVALTRDITGVCTADAEDHKRLVLFNPTTGARRAENIAPGCSTVVGADDHWIVCEDGTWITAARIRSLRVVRLANNRRNRATSRSPAAGSPGPKTPAATNASAPSIYLARPGSRTLQPIARLPRAQGYSGTLAQSRVLLLRGRRRFPPLGSPHREPNRRCLP